MGQYPYNIVSLPDFSLSIFCLKMFSIFCNFESAECKSFLYIQTSVHSEIEIADANCESKLKLSN